MEKEIIQIMTIPDGIKVELVDNHTISLTNDKGNLTRKFKSHLLKLKVNGQKITLEGTPVNKKTRALLMTVVAHIKNMVEGLLFGYKFNMKLVYSHFPMTAKVEGKEIIISNFAGEKFNRRAQIVGDTKVEIKGEDVTVTGISKEDVGQTAANMELATKLRGKDIRRFQDGIYTVKKGNIDEKTEEELVEVSKVEEEEVPKDGGEESK